MSGRQPSLQDRILKALAGQSGLTDRALTDLIFGKAVHPSRINQECRLMAGRGLILREKDALGAICNSMPGTAPHLPPLPAKPPPSPPDDRLFLSEDDLKRHLVGWLEGDGWATQVAWGRTRGADILATRGGRSWVIEAKGSGTLQPMRVNYFLGALGELLQRMSDPAASYSIALPDLGQFRGLWQRLPVLAKQRLGISALFVAPDGRVDHAIES